MNINSSSGHAQKKAETPSCDAFVAFLLISQEELHASEKINIWRARSLAEKIGSEGVWTVPILVEKHHHVVMDGHHRLWAAKELGLRRVPCIVTDYDNPHLSLTRWVSGEAFKQRCRMRFCLKFQSYRNCLFHPIRDAATLSLLLSYPEIPIKIRPI